MKLIKKRGVWHVSIRTASGRTKTITTRCTDRRQAVQAVKRSGLAALENAARTTRLTQEALGHILTDRKLTIGQAIRNWAEWMAATGKAPRTVHNHQSVINRWMRKLQIENLPPSAITPQHIDGWVNNPDLTAKVGTRKLMLAALRVFFHFCSAKGYCIGNPTKLVRINLSQLTHTQKEPRVKKPFTDEEFQQLLHVIDQAESEVSAALDTNEGHLLAQGKPPGETRSWGGKFSALEQGREKLEARLRQIVFWRCASLLGRHTGLRLGDIACLEWASLENPGKLIVWTGKTDARVEVPLHDEAVRALQEIARRDLQWCFPEVRVTCLDVKRRATLSVEFTRLCRRARLEGHSFHDLRHTFVTVCHTQGIPMPHIARLVGHASENTTAIYIHDAGS